MIFLEDANTQHDLTKVVKINDGGKSISVQFSNIEKMILGTYQLKIKYSTAKGSELYSYKTFSVKSRISNEVQIAIAQTALINSPEKYNQYKDYPQTFPVLNTNEAPFIHV